MKQSNVSLTIAERAQAALTVGQVIRQKRVERGISGNELCRRAQISRSYLTKMEDGTFHDLRLDKFCRIVEALGVSAQEVLEEAGYIAMKTKTALPEPADYLRERYKLSPGALDQVVEYVDWVARRDHQERRMAR